MKEAFIIFIVVVIVGYIYKQNDPSFSASTVIKQSDIQLPIDQAPNTQNFECDGREYCSQMTSCEEATYFLNNCPGVKMDGDGDGIACERQFCG